MFEKTSRYYSVGFATMHVLDSDGLPHEIRYVQRRFIPSDEGTTTLIEHTFTQGDRLDNITARYLGDPTLFWRVCDANVVLSPAELTDEIGQVIRIAMPQL